MINKAVLGQLGTAEEHKHPGHGHHKLRPTAEEHCSKYGFCIIMPEGIMDLRFVIMLLVGMSWADVLSVMLSAWGDV